MPGLICPTCKTPENSVVHNSRPAPNARWRRRTCLTCGARFTTSERVASRRLVALLTALETCDELE